MDRFDIIAGIASIAIAVIGSYLLVKIPLCAKIHGFNQIDCNLSKEQLIKIIHVLSGINCTHPEPFSRN